MKKNIIVLISILILLVILGTFSFVKYQKKVNMPLDGAIVVPGGDDGYSGGIYIDGGIGISLLENGNIISHNNYTDDDEFIGTLKLTEQNIIPGNEYQEVLSMKNTGGIDVYTRVIIRRYWIDEGGNRTYDLDPGMIILGLTNTSDWIVDEEVSTQVQDRTVLFYKHKVSTNTETKPFINKITISSSINKWKVDKSVTSDGHTRMTMKKAYEGYKPVIEVEADDVQSNNAEDAIMSAWGRDVTIDKDGELSLN